ncbi:Guanine nucleotide-binding protein-like 3-like protein [Apophysomyces ossiformis]|uniref:Guanine nucleotide-binding protein-like 3-like protein n=1 Tax=Apophysomyces ossiformis TaxID=679940 RepID=A0A8H7BPM1_9FUNG|nr:Guanine nucleotide-binding protein-like 3-like protein [Apophysomyces ossiformis]
MGALKGKKARNANRLNGGKLKKDPGVPNLSHFLQKKKNKELEQQKKKRESRHNDHDEVEMSEANPLLDLLRQNEERQREYDGMMSSTNEDSEKMIQDGAAAGQKDNSKKAYYKEFKKVLENADVVLEILDARDPLGTRTRHVERMIMDSGLNKRVILVLNKIDLVPKENVESWLKYLRNEYPTIAFKASTQNQRRNLGQSSVSTDAATDKMLNSSECLGADTLVKLLKNYCRNVNIKTSITVGIIGYPNVGKSSVINSLKRSKVCGVGSTPGFTKVAQQITLDKNIKLLDCPGIVFAAQGQDGQTDAEIALRNCVKVELLEDPITPVEVITSRCSMEQLCAIYNVGFFNNAHEFLVLLAMQRGKLKKGGIPDTESVARAVLQDWNGGKIPFFTVPPATTNVHVDAAIVSAWSKEFDMSQLPNEMVSTA